MSYKPQRSFMGSEGDYSVDYFGPEALKTDIDNLMNMFDPTATHPDGTPGGIDFDNLGFKFISENMASLIGVQKIIGIEAAQNVQAYLEALMTLIRDRYTKAETDEVAKTAKEEAISESNKYTDETAEERLSGLSFSLTDEGLLRVTYDDGEE